MYVFCSDTIYPKKHSRLSFHADTHSNIQIYIQIDLYEQKMAAMCLFAAFSLNSFFFFCFILGIQGSDSQELISLLTRLRISSIKTQLLAFPSTYCPKLEHSSISYTSVLKNTMASSPLECRCEQQKIYFRFLSDLFSLSNATTGLSSLQHRTNIRRIRYCRSCTNT